MFSVTRSTLKSSFIPALLVIATACQTYDFEPVTPLTILQSGQSYQVSAKGLHPDLMILVDRSASMSYTDCPGCATRMNQLKSTMSTFLSTYGTDARIGFVAFSSPSGKSACAPTTLDDITSSGVPLPITDDDNDLQASAEATNLAISKLSPAGGTPTAASLSTLVTYDTLTAADPNRLKLVLLMTDGLPNCNPLNPNNQCTAVNPLCACTAQNPADCDPGAYGCALSCTDQDASVNSILDLIDRKVNTVVVGFGADTSTGTVPDVLNAMADAGGFARTCPNGTDAECKGPSNDPNDGCNPDLTCKKKYYQANTGDDLGQALQDIVNRISHPCTWALDDVPNDPTLLSVVVNGVTIAPGATTWSYDSTDNAIVFVDSGTVCQELKTSTVANPVKLEIRLVNKVD